LNSGSLAPEHVPLMSSLHCLQVKTPKSPPPHKALTWAMLKTTASHCSAQPSPTPPPRLGRVLRGGSPRGHTACPLASVLHLADRQIVVGHLPWLVPSQPPQRDHPGRSSWHTAEQNDPSAAIASTFNSIPSAFMRSVV
jgi:hypothetical protein